MAGLNESLVDFTEIEIQGKKYKAGILTLGDWAEFEQYAQKLHRRKIIDTAKELYGNEIPDIVFDKATKTLTEAEINSYQESIEGITFLLWKALVKYNPNMTAKEISEMVTLVNMGKLFNSVTGQSNAGQKKRKRQPVKRKER